MSRLLKGHKIPLNGYQHINGHKPVMSVMLDMSVMRALCGLYIRDCTVFGRVRASNDSHTHDACWSAQPT